MSRPGRPFAFLYPGDRLPVLFLLGIVLPGIVLVVFSARALLQERRAARQQQGERLDRVARTTAEDLEAELERWQESVDELATTGAFAAEGATEALPAARWPTRVRRALDSPYGVALLYRTGEQTAVLPSTRTLWAPGAPSSRDLAAPPPSGLVTAERAESNGDFARALTLYLQLLERAAESDRALLLHRVARTSHKAGRRAEALRYYDELLGLRNASVGVLPAELVARHAIASLHAENGHRALLASNALELYRGLVVGRWWLEEPRYLFYAEQARGWLGLETTDAPDSPAGSPPPGDGELAVLHQTELGKLTFGALVESFLEEPRAVPGAGTNFGMAFWSSDPFVALIFPAAAVEALVWAPVSARTIDSQVAVALRHDDGRMLAGAGAAPADAMQSSRGVSGRRVPLTVQAWPADPATVESELAARQALYVGMLALVVVLLAFGSYLTVRTVRHEVEVARLKSRFVSAVSHEFRSPLTGIRQLAEMLLRDRVPGEERKQRYYSMIARESSRLSRLVENVLDFSRIEENRREYDKRPLDTTSWLAAVVEDFRHELHEHDVAVAADIPAGLPPLRADREALSCAVHNLLDNAVKYSAGADTVWLEAAATDGTVVIRVRDLGAGISREDRRRVFEKFFRAGGATADEVKGVGLGLSLVQHIVTAHGGTVGLESELGSGSTFTIELPVDAEGG